MNSRIRRILFKSRNYRYSFLEMSDPKRQRVCTTAESDRHRKKPVTPRRHDDSDIRSNNNCHSHYDDGLRRKKELTDDKMPVTATKTSQSSLPSSVVGRAPVLSRTGGGLFKFRISEEKETDQSKISQRLKQVKYGKNTLGYDNYTRTVNKCEREPRNPKHPVTPDVYRLQSKKSFDGYVKSWRRALHLWDSQAEALSDLDGLVEATMLSKLCSPGSLKKNQSTGLDVRISTGVSIEVVDYEEDASDDGDDVL